MICMLYQTVNKGIGKRIVIDIKDVHYGIQCLHDILKGCLSVKNFHSQLIHCVRKKVTPCVLFYNWGK